ncbi:hypothetical protein LOK49_LG01G03464 [Camellia lanceoleosa]|uniref:Uncharacterized protein n=1 Tax=Camellia lanceoleosa TaxID=1840588 RepID=A0ACC0J3J9_9ERIC|nr:hypothetical protein LOK49_LG01G03464 [Camellia lanceoleosa]
MELIGWLDTHSILWTENGEKTQYLEMKAQHQQLFKSTLEGLYRLHKQKRCHGNLLHGVWVLEDGDPKFQLKFADMDLDANKSLSSNKFEFSEGFGDLPERGI